MRRLGTAALGGLLALALAACGTVPPTGSGRPVPPSDLTPSAVPTSATAVPTPSASPQPPEPTSEEWEPSDPPETTEPPEPAQTPVAPVPQACLAEARALPLAERAGQLVMVGVEGDLDAAEKTAIQKHHIGSVILMGNSNRGVKKTRKLTDAIQKAGGKHLLIGVDQEGGKVQRLTGPGFTDIPSAAQQAKLPGEQLYIQARAWGRQLVKAGVQLNLAPVADVVPPQNVARNEPIAKLGRGYGTDPEVVSEKVVAYVYAMHQVNVGTAVKHFPGLGAVAGNTDFETRVVDSTTTADSPLLEPFRRALTPGVGGVDLNGELVYSDAVMISSVVYDKIDPKNQAVFSPTVIGIVRGWGFNGVVISDDLGAAKALSKVPAKDRAARFVAAGGDLAISVSPSVAGDMVTGIVARAKKDKAFASKVTTSAARVLALKQSYGLATCTS